MPTNVEWGNSLSNASSIEATNLFFKIIMLVLFALCCKFGKTVGEQGDSKCDLLNLFLSAGY